MFLTNDPYHRERRKSLRNNMTGAEKKLWKYIKNRQFLDLKFRRQFGVGPYILDFYLPERLICIEIDGDSHFEEDAQIYDNKRTSYLQARGIRVIRYTNQEIYRDIEVVLENLMNMIQNTPPNLP